MSSTKRKKNPQFPLKAREFDREVGVRAVLWDLWDFVCLLRKNKTFAGIKNIWSNQIKHCGEIKTLLPDSGQVAFTIMESTFY